MTFSFPPSETSHLHTNFSMQKETLLQHVFYDYNTFYHFRSTIWQNKRRIDALLFSILNFSTNEKSMQTLVVCMLFIMRLLILFLHHLQEHEQTGLRYMDNQLL
ncbi:hypothetical protein EKA14_07570 [Bacillus mycoides]|nr:hypothetical protein EKA14_07570 [Bacillus mycoides]